MKRKLDWVLFVVGVLILWCLIYIAWDNAKAAGMSRIIEMEQKRNHEILKAK